MTVDGSLMTANDTDESVPVTTAEEEEGGGGGYVCGGATDTELELFYKFSWWNEGVLQVVVCTVGFLANALSIPVLFSKAMNSVFNRLLVALAILDNLYLTFSILESIRRELLGATRVHSYLFVYALYPLANINLCCSIYMTTVLALERYMAVARPVHYHNAVNSGKKWVRIVRYVLPVVLFSVASHVPKFFELRVEEEEVSPWNRAATNSTASEGGDEAEAVLEPTKSFRIVPTPLRMNEDYVFYYGHIARLLITGIVPFASLVVFNFGIYQAVRRRRAAAFRGNSGPAHQAAEENRQALVLVAIVIFFLVTNAPRNFLNLNEVITYERVQQDYKHGCKGLPLWVLLTGSVSHILLDINSSLNFFLYCLMSSTFRSELAKLLGVRTLTPPGANSNTAGSRRGEGERRAMLDNKAATKEASASGCKDHVAHVARISSSTGGKAGATGNITNV